MDISRRIRDVFKLWQRDMSPGGQVWVKKDGELIFAECFGYADIERRVKNAPETIFHVASVSKQITCMSVFLLRERGLVDIDADIREYIPDLVAFSEPVTVRDMMNNVSGIRDQWVLQMFGGVRMGDIITQDDLLYLNKRQKELNFPPRSRYLYSNTNFVYLSEIIRRVSGATLNDFAMENIFIPLNMGSTFIRANYDDLVDNRALSYEDDGSGNYKWKPLNFSNNGATSLHTTADDFMKWLGNFKNPVICKPETLQEMFKVPALTTDNETNYACGLMIDDRGGHKCIGHGGADAGYRSQVCHFPDDGLDIVILANVENIPMAPAAFKIADIVLGTDTAPVSAKFSGEYAPPVLGRFCITELSMGVEIDDGNIAYAGKRMPLVHEDGNRYACGYLSSKICFTGEGPFFESGAMAYKLKALRGAGFTPGELEDVQGLYYSCDTESFYRIIIEDGKAEMEHKRLGRAEIFSVGGGIYYCPLENEMVFKLIKDGAGRITGFTVMDGRVLSIDFHKTELKKI